MKDMKLSKESKEKYSEPTLVSDKPQYPYGLCLNLDSDSLKNLGISKLPAVGDKMVVSAMVEVTRVSSYSSEKEKSNDSMELQITSMELGPEKEAKSSEDVLYGKE